MEDEEEEDPAEGGRFRDCASFCSVVGVGAVVAEDDDDGVDDVDDGDGAGVTFFSVFEGVGVVVVVEVVKVVFGRVVLLSEEDFSGVAVVVVVVVADADAGDAGTLSFSVLTILLCGFSLALFAASSAVGAVVTFVAVVVVVADVLSLSDFGSVFTTSDWFAVEFPS